MWRDESLQDKMISESRINSASGSNTPSHTSNKIADEEHPLKLEIRGWLACVRECDSSICRRHDWDACKHAYRNDRVYMKLPARAETIKQVIPLGRNLLPTCGVFRTRLSVYHFLTVISGSIALDTMDNAVEFSG
jgi:hypothetical protein